MLLTESFLSIAERLIFGIGILLNMFLLHCILSRSKYDLGAYKYMQVLFVVVDIAYATVQVVLVERFIAQDSVTMIFGLGRYANNLIVITAYLALYSLTFVVIDYNFLYRLWALKSPNRISWFSQKRFITILVGIATAECCFWFYISYVYFAATEHGRQKLANVALQKFGIDAMTQAVSMGDYFNEDGSRNWGPTVAVIALCTVMFFCFGFMLFASLNIITFLRNSKLISKAGLALQRQLFVTLSAQTLIPFTLLYAPCGVNILFPFLGLDASFVADLSPLSLALFLPFDAIAVLYLMKDYRKAFLHFLSCGRLVLHPT